MSSDNSNLVFVDAQDLINPAENPADLSLSTNVVMAGLWYDLKLLMDSRMVPTYYYPDGHSSLMMVRLHYQIYQSL